MESFIYSVSNSNQTVRHYGVKGMRWGVRRYQYADGTLTPAGQKRYSNKKSDIFKVKVDELVGRAKTQITGKQYVDGYLKKGTTFSRIQTSKNFENFAFYATYKKQDVDKYMGLFGKNLMTRAKAEAYRAEKEAQKSKDPADQKKAMELRQKADSLNVYQLHIKATKKLRIPSDENASDITVSLLKDTDFKSDLVSSILDSKEKMKRPSQQILFNQALKALQKKKETCRLMKNNPYTKRLTCR